MPAPVHEPMLHTVSTWPSSEPTNGLEFMRSSLAAVTARFCSRAAMCGCSRGLGLRGRAYTSLLSERVIADTSRDMALIFMVVRALARRLGRGLGQVRPGRRGGAAGTGGGLWTRSTRLEDGRPAGVAQEAATTLGS